MVADLKRSAAGGTLSLSLTGSKLQRWFLAVGHGLALIAVGLSAMPTWGKLPACAALTVSSVRAWRSARPPLAQILYDGERWTLVDLDQQVWHGELLGSTWCSRWLTLLHFRLQSRRFLAVPIWRDSLLQDDWRRLQGVLRWQVRFQR